MRLPDVRVVRQLNAGKPAALNTGLAHASHDLIVMMDGDTVFEPATVRELVQPFGDPRVGAVAGNAKVGNRDTLIGAWQHIEYVMGFNLDRRMYDVLGCMPTIPGAVGAFRREALERVGGMSDDTLAEDTDITMALHRDGWRVVYAENARAWTEAPESVQQLWSQRYRWSYGTMQAIWKHRRAVVERGSFGPLRPGRAAAGRRCSWCWPRCWPRSSTSSCCTGWSSARPQKTVVAWLAVLAVQAVCAAYAFRAGRERHDHLISLPLQQILYRQLMYVVLLQSWITALTGGRLRWQKLRRTGVVAAPRASPTRAGRRNGREHRAARATAGSPSWRDADATPVPAAPRTGERRPAAAESARRPRPLPRPAARARPGPGGDLPQLRLGLAAASLFPSMGVMFALAGSLMARSLAGRRWASSGAGCAGCCRRCGCSARSW